MGRKAIIIDINRCNGCHNCQVACKDEHCEQPWLPYAQEQPLTGQFWWKVQQLTRGSVPKVRMTYIPRGCNHCDDCPLLELAPDAVYRRDDGFIVIDPEKSKGRKDLVEACPYDAVFWNDKFEIPQKCTGCAHLLDDDWEVPRCVDACVVQAMRYVDMDDPEYADKFAQATTIAEENGNARGGLVYYLNYPKRFIAGEVYDEEEDEVIIGATITLAKDGAGIAKVESDDFGDFWFEQIEAGAYTLYFEAPGYMTRMMEVDATEKDINIGGLALYRE